MPSDAKKKQQAKKKEAAKARASGNKKGNKSETNGSGDKESSPCNGVNGSVANGSVAISEEGDYYTFY